MLSYGETEREREKRGERERKRDNSLKSEINSDFVYKDRSQSAKHQEK